MNSEELPLTDFFITLHKAGLPIGISDYKLLLKAFQGGFGITAESLERLCKALWIRSDDEERLFDYHFNLIKPELIRKQKFIQSEFSEKPKEQTEKIPESKIIPETKQSEPIKSSPEISSELMRMEDEAEGAKVITAIQANRQNVDEFPYIPMQFVLTGDYLPITRRQMKQTWRYLRCFVRQGTRKEIDIEATVNEIGRNGFLLKPVIVPSRINKAELLLLIDQNGSMVPFHALSQRLRETAIRGGRFGKTYVYYFHNIPHEWLYQDTALIEGEKTDDVMARLHPKHSKHTHVVILSDAGAARGWFNSERLKATLTFFSQISIS